MIGLLMAAALAATAAPEPQDDPAAKLADLQRIWQQSCAERAYGSYNDVCNSMRDQIAAYRRQAARETRAARTRPSPPVAKPPVTPAMGFAPSRP